MHLRHPHRCAARGAEIGPFWTLVSMIQMRPMVPGEAGPWRMTCLFARSATPLQVSICAPFPLGPGALLRGGSDADALFPVANVHKRAVDMAISTQLTVNKNTSSSSQSE